jgi:hypothetical protein
MNYGVIFVHLERKKKKKEKFQLSLRCISRSAAPLGMHKISSVTTGFATEGEDLEYLPALTIIPKIFTIPQFLSFVYFIFIFSFTKAYNNVHQQPSLSQSPLIILYFFFNGAPDIHPTRRKRPGYPWHRFLVRPAGAPDLAQLPDQKHSWATRVHDAALVGKQRAIRCLCYSSAV